MMFVQNGCPAMAITSQDFMPSLSAEMTHTPKDTPDLVDGRKLVNIARALAALAEKLGR